jgi:hypothetical protein
MLSVVSSTGNANSPAGSINANKELTIDGGSATRHDVEAASDEEWATRDDVEAASDGGWATSD